MLGSSESNNEGRPVTIYQKRAPTTCLHHVGKVALMGSRSDIIYNTNYFQCHKMFAINHFRDTNIRANVIIANFYDSHIHSHDIVIS